MYAVPCKPDRPSMHCVESSSVRGSNMAILIFTILLSVTVKMSYTIYSCECEYQTMSIDCPEGKIKIQIALYGRINNTCCPWSTYQNEDLQCASNKSMGVVKERCQDTSNCTVPAENDYFGDPCVGVFKYLAVNYTCEIELPNCPREVVHVDGVRLTFPEATSRGQIDSVELCLDGTLDSNRSLGTRLCTEAWGTAELRRECYNSSTLGDSLEQMNLINVTQQNVADFAANMFLISNLIDDITPTIVESLTEALASVVEVASSSEQVTDSVVGVVDNLMAFSKEMTLESVNGGDIVLLLEDQVARVHLNGKNYTESGTYLEVSALQMGLESLAGGLTLDHRFTRDEVNMSDEEDSVRKSSIRLPPSIADIIRKERPDIPIVPITFITYLDANLFQPSFTDTEETTAPSSYVDSHVLTVTVELDDVIIRDLPPNSSVLIKFSTPIIPRAIASNATVEFVCVYWEYIETTGRGRWLQEGCTRVASTDEEILCSCNHLTSLALLVTIHIVTVPGYHEVILHVITVVGCVISIAGLSISVIVMLAFRTIREKQQTHVHLNLCLSLLGLYLSFLLGIGRSDQPQLCKAMASLIYFFCLSSTVWMSVEAFYVYALIWNYQRSSVEHFMLVTSLFAWGVPGVVSLLMYFLFNDHDYKPKEYCFLQPAGKLFYFGFLAFIFLLFLCNSTVFALATYRVSCRKIFTTGDSRNAEIVTRIKSTMLFWILLGISWLFGFLSIIPGPLKIVFQVIFCTLLALQGFFMFYMLIVQNPEVRKHCTNKTMKKEASPKMVEETKSSPLPKEVICHEYSTADLKTTSANQGDEFYEFELELRSLDCIF
ncbi:Adhesion G-protein coupled receptor G4 [Holothuria leucospilota]|uniref:Adhesion G-protein coupled receptor G4 n=1 Tax=Holothuria leucospilota TaxID=206669 RepID=A0A9Q1CC77_HOLLE|nr:Adhesion G-protein coupled receptor G4 [Holothuria leucospilota]